MTNESHNEGICIVLIVGMLFYFNYYDQKQLKEEKERKIEKEYFMNEINHLKLTIVELEKKNSFSLVLCKSPFLHAAQSMWCK